MIEKNRYTISRTGIVKFYDSSRIRAGRQAIGNQLNEIIGQFCDKWTSATTKDAIPFYLKNIFLLEVISH